MSRQPLRSCGGSSSAFSGSSAVLRKTRKRVRQDRSLMRDSTRILFHSASPVPDKHAPTDVARVPSQAFARSRLVHAPIGRLLDRMRERQLVAIWVGQVEISFAP